MNGAGSNGIGRHIQRVDKAGAGRAKVKGARFVRVQPILHQAGCAGEYILRRRGGDHNQIEIGGQDIGNFQRLLRRSIGQGRGRLAFVGDETLTNACARVNPLVAGLDECRQLVISHG